MTDNILKVFKVKTDPTPNSKSIVKFGFARFTVLTSRLIRIEYSSNNIFEDRASQLIWFRNFETPDFTTEIVENKLIIETEHLILIYIDTQNGFLNDNLKIKLKGMGRLWEFGAYDWANLKGTARTLDGINGSLNLEDGLISKEGWTVVDDSDSLVLDENGWPCKRDIMGIYQDIYFFGYEHEYKQCIKDFCKLAGKMPLIPRWALGNWWSKYWAYTDSELKKLMSEFKDHKIPLSVCVVDMDWHIIQNPYHGGWTGYTFNKEYYKNPKEFLDWMHSQKLKVSLNLHPADGVAPHEEKYQEFAEFMGMNPDENKTIRFDIANPRFAEGYFKYLHHPLEKEGVDFWWIDWQQGSKSKLKGLDPLWMLNHLHFYDQGKERTKREFCFSRWCGLGGHRYPIGFSGDAFETWDTLSFEPNFTATSANVGFSWWSHDISGHFHGNKDPELYTRWVQYGVFSPIFRLHSCKNEMYERRPWMYEEKYAKPASEAMRLRHKMVPYIYSMAYRAYRYSEVLITPLYYSNPEEEEAYNCPNQYWFGSQLLAVPVTSPEDSELNLSRQIVWLPQGEWYDFFTGEYYKGGKKIAVYSEINDIPVFAKAGAIVPMNKYYEFGTQNPKELEFHIFPGNGNFELYEDDGESKDYSDGAFVLTKIISSITDKQAVIKVEQQGNLTVIPQNRSYIFVLKGVKNPNLIKTEINNEIAECQVEYDENSSILKINLNDVSVGSKIKITVTSNDNIEARLDLSENKVRKAFQKMKTSYDIAGGMQWLSGDIKNNPAILTTRFPQMTMKQQMFVLETLFHGEICTLVGYNNMK